MNRREAHMQAMLRHLGAAYYESLHGRASASDVARALHTVEESAAEPAKLPAETAARPATHGGAHGHSQPRRGRWHRRVRDVMTTSVVTADPATSYKEVARLLAQHKISALPVLTMGRHVAGVVSETDLIQVQYQRARNARAGKRPAVRWRTRGRPVGRTAGDLMTSPAITISADATIPAAARVMTARQVKCLPVVDPDGNLIGIVSRRDLLGVFLRPDADIAADVRAIFTDILLTDPASLHVTVKQGIVILAGEAGELEQPGLIHIATRLTWDIDGVVDVVDNLAAAQPG